jgi:hypothetical protein
MNDQSRTSKSPTSSPNRPRKSAEVAQLTFTCPFCASIGVTMGIVGHSIPPNEFIQAKHLRPHGFVYSVCGICWRPICAEVTSKNHKTVSQHASFNTAFSRALAQPYAVEVGELSTTIVRTPDVDGGIPEHLSPPVEKAFRSAERNFNAPDGEDAAAMLYRRAIDVAIKEKHPDVKGMLAARIQTLVKKGLLPPSMKDWGDQIRLIGNDGAHEPEGVTMEDLKPMRGFTEAFLRYFISIPFEVARARSEIDAKDSPLQAVEEPD